MTTGSFETALENARLVMEMQPRLGIGIGIGILDTVSEQTSFTLDSPFVTAFYNPVAAVPSLHAGFAFALGSLSHRRRLGRGPNWSRSAGDR